jgi:diphthamide biosynthesis methyltransferase
MVRRDLSATHDALLVSSADGMIARTHRQMLLPAHVHTAMFSVAHEGLHFKCFSRFCLLCMRQNGLLYV